MSSLTIALRLLVAAVLAAVVNGGALASETPMGPVLKAKSECRLTLSHGTLKVICGKSKSAKNKDGGGQDKDVGSQGERSCPPGYVVLKEKNKYGAYCEPKEGFPTQEGGGTGGQGGDEKIEDNPCFGLCSNQCGGPTKEARDACVLDCVQATSCTPR